MVCTNGQTCNIDPSLISCVRTRVLDEPLPPLTFMLYESTSGKELYDYVEEQYRIQAENFKLHLLSGKKLIDLSEVKDKTMSELGVEFSFDQDLDNAKLIVANLQDTVTYQYGLLIINPVKLDDLKDKKECRTKKKNGCKRLKQTQNMLDKSDTCELSDKPPPCYIGLVNQAMTCYLNSLLQALYMTPEFRNALYNWEYVEGSEKDEASSMPYQLQKLFLNLQTSTRPAVETTALTKSFGWDSTEAWQQHDIQELCRVMFDALEQKFANTEQADFINRLYEGRMIDYVKCLECGTEKSREDTFLDIPLPVRPFGSNAAYSSVEEAMRAFVQPETLEGVNQYHCEKCNKKCDAHKGLKFTKFPYLLTLHLKRFDFDYKTFYRIKLNDRVTFPEILNLNSLISTDDDRDSPDSKEEDSFVAKCDDNSTVDSGTANDDNPLVDSSLGNSDHSTNHDQDDDEGLEMSNGASAVNGSPDNHKNERNHVTYQPADDPYQYELFSIMIHSGSASGGHYYAYIKDFRTQDWFCFNDQNVTQITDDDIQKTFGGGPSKAYYSGAFSSSTNAYMLMYRQIDPERNALPMEVEDFPKHIQELLKKMKENNENDVRNRDKQYHDDSCNLYKIKVYCRRSKIGGESRDITLYLMSDVTLGQVKKDVYDRLFRDKTVSLNQCRLVRYDPNNDLIERSYPEAKEKEAIGSIWPNQTRINLLMELRCKDEKFETYLPDGIMTKVYVVDVVEEELIDGPISVRALLTQTVKEYKEMLGDILNIDPETMKIVLRKQNNVWPLKNNNIELQYLQMWPPAKVFVASIPDAESNNSRECPLRAMSEKFERVFSLNVSLPDTSKEVLEALEIPPLEEKKPLIDEVYSLLVSDFLRTADSKSNDVSKTVQTNDETSARGTSPQLRENEEWNTPEQSNSEDSSLSDNDKTLVDDAPEYDDFLSFHEQDFDFRVEIPQNNSESSSLNDSSKNLVGDAPEDDSTAFSERERRRRRRMFYDYYDNKFYFKAVPNTNDGKKSLKIFVDEMMRLGTLKNYLEPYVGVSTEYFNFVSTEYFNISLTDQLAFYKDCERLTIKLGRGLQSGEVNLKLYQFLPDASKPYKFLYERAFSNDMTFGEAKKEILAELKEKCDIDIPYERCRLRERYLGVPSRIFLNDQKFEDFRFNEFTLMLVQELPDKDPVTDPHQIAMFVKSYTPYSQFQEIILDNRTTEELKKKVSAISNIPEEYVELAQANEPFPCKRVCSWNELICNPCFFSVGNSTVFFYRDSREKTVTTEPLNSVEAREALPKETSRLMSLPTIGNYTAGSRRERALKIYLDSK